MGSSSNRANMFATIDREGEPPTAVDREDMEPALREQEAGGDVEGAHLASSAQHSDQVERPQTIQVVLDDVLLSVSNVAEPMGHPANAHGTPMDQPAGQVGPEPETFSDEGVSNEVQHSPSSGGSLPAVFGTPLETPSGGTVDEEAVSIDMEIRGDSSDSRVDDAGQEFHGLSSEVLEVSNDEEVEVPYDTSIAARHEYLGDCDALVGSYIDLDEGEEYMLPVLPLDGVVLMPGTTLPLKLCRLGEVQLLDTALRLPPPCSRLLVVVHWSRLLMVPNIQFGCTAEIRQMRRQDDGSVHALAKGRQRVVVSFAEGDRLVQTRVRVLPKGDVSPLPRPIRDGYAYAPHWAGKVMDPDYLADRARKLCASVLPTAGGFQGSPLAYSYYLASNLPLGCSTRQRLLEVPNASLRLREEVKLLESQLGQLQCCDCGCVVADARDTMLMTEEGIGGAFVNAHGFVHDMATFRRIKAVAYQGEPEEEHSWFPGFAWTICNCRHCYNHLGWRFTAVRGGLSPPVFWGLRRSALACPSEADQLHEGALAGEEDYDVIFDTQQQED